VLVVGDELLVGLEVGALDYELLGFRRESELRAMAVDDRGDEGVGQVVCVLG
jgi:hypothetical protein